MKIRLNRAYVSPATGHEPIGPGVVDVKNRKLAKFLIEQGLGTKVVTRRRRKPEVAKDETAN